MKIAQKINSKNILVTICLISFAQYLFAEPYRVRLGDTLSKIASTYLPGRIYGVNGSLAKLLLANPQVRDANRIYAGSEVEIPEIKIVQKLSSFQSPTVEDKAEGPAGPLDVSAKVEVEDEDVLHDNKPISELVSTQTTFLYQFITGFTRLESNNSSGTKAIANSGLGFGLALSWLQKWSANFHSWMGVNARKYSFEISQNKNLSDFSFLYSDLSLGLRHPFSKGSYIEVSLNYEQGAGLISTDALTTMKLEKITTPAVSLSSKLSLIQVHDLSLSVLLGAGYQLAYSSDRIRTKSSLRYKGGLDVSYQRAWGSFSTSLIYDYLMLKTTNGMQSDKKLELSFALSQDF